MFLQPATRQAQALRTLQQKKQTKGTCTAWKSVVNCLTKDNNQKDYDHETTPQI